MRIRKIIFENFRAFYGVHEIEFSYEDNSVNLIVAENEVGKTTILNSLLWCLYDKFTDDSEMSEIILNRQAKKLGESKARVIIELIDPINYEDYDPDCIQISRTHIAGKSSNPLHVHKIDGITGETTAVIDDPKEFVNSFCPEAISKYFFFDGEGMQKLTTNQVLLQQAIRSIQGLNSAEGALKDLEKFQSKRQSEFNKANANNTELTSLNKAITDLDDKEAKLAKENIDLAQKSSELQSQKLQHNKKIGELGTDAVTELQTDIKNLEKDIKNSKERKLLWEKKQEVFIGEKSLAVASYQHMKDITDFMAKQKKTGSLPSGYEEVFVNKLLKKLVCICGEEFKKGDKRYKEIESMLAEARTEALDNKIFQIESASLSYVKKIESFNTDRGEIDTQVHHFNEKIDKDEDKLKAFKELLENTDQSAIAAAAKKITQIETELWSLMNKSNRNEHSLRDLGNKKAEKKRKRAGLTTATKFLESEQAELDFLESTIEYLTTLIAEQEMSGKERIVELMNDYLRRFARGNNSFAFRGDGYIPIILESGVEEVDADNLDEDNIAILSQGGAAVKRNLFFATSLTALSKERKDDKDNYNIPGSIAPLVVDAPFSNLDTTNTSNLSKLLVSNADQLIIMISSSAYNNGFADTMNEKKFKKQLQTSHYLTRQYSGKNEGSNKEERDKQETRILVNGKSIQTSFYENSIETSHIVKIK